MGKIKITSDKYGVFKSDTVMNVMDFMSQYFKETEDKALVDWLQRIPIPSAVDYIAQEWGLTYRFV
jgi:hypothetical protein